MEYKRKPLSSFNQIPQQKVKKRDVFTKNNDYKINDYNKTKDQTEGKTVEVIELKLFIYIMN